MKTCAKCKQSKQLDSFKKSKQCKDGLYSYCRACDSQDKRVRRLNNIELYRKRDRDKYHENVELMRERAKKHYLNNREQHIAKCAEYVKNNKSAVIERKRAWYLKNRESVIKRTKDNDKRLYKTSICYRIGKVLRSRLVAVIRGKTSNNSAVRNLGCSLQELKSYLESKFQPGMNWDNYGRTGWHIDHIMPLSSFDLTDPEQLAKACHYSNLQPLWAKDNLRKSDNILDQT